MNCGCETYQCINVFADPCNEVVTLPITANDTGIYKMVFQFNGVNFRIDVPVISGENLTIPTSYFNENYTHVVQFYTEAGVLFLNTCYKLNIMQTVFTNPVEPIIYQNYLWVFAKGNAPETNVNPSYKVAVENGNTITHPSLSDQVLSVRIGTQDVEPISSEGYEHNPNTQTITFANPVSDINIYVQTKQVPQ